MSAPEWRLAKLVTTKIAAVKIADVKERRQKAYALTMAGKLAEAAEGADRAPNLLGASSRKPSRAYR